MRRIWLCADDYGISPAVSLAVRDLVLRGRLNATSVIVVAPSFTRSEAKALAILNATAPRVALGLHVTLTAPFRPSSRDFAPLREGAFMPLSATVRHAFLRRFDRGALRREIASQLNGFTGLFGRLPDFIDGHQHVHLLPQISDAVLGVACEEAPNAWLRQCGRASPSFAGIADAKGFFLDLLSRSFRRRAETAGLRTNAAFAGTYAFRDNADFQALFPSFLHRLPDRSVVMCHPGFVDRELQRLDPLTTLREREHAFFASDAFPALLATHGITLR